MGGRHTAVGNRPCFTLGQHKASTSQLTSQYAQVTQLQAAHTPRPGGQAMASPATAGKPCLHVSAVFQCSRSLFLQMGTFKLRVRRNIDSPESAAPVHAVAAAAAPAAVAAAAPAAAAAPYVSMDEPPYESIDEAHVYVTVPKVRFDILVLQLLLEKATWFKLVVYNVAVLTPKFRNFEEIFATK